MKQPLLGTASSAPIDSNWHNTVSARKETMNSRLGSLHNWELALTHPLTECIREPWMWLTHRPNRCGPTDVRFRRKSKILRVTLPHFVWTQTFVDVWYKTQIASNDTVPEVSPRLSRQFVRIRGPVSRNQGDLAQACQSSHEARCHIGKAVGALMCVLLLTVSASEAGTTFSPHHRFQPSA